jgi:hypothetical protein
VTSWRRVRSSLLALLVAVLATFGALAASGVIGTAGAAPTWTITASAGTGGSISPSGAVTVNDGADQTFTIAPDTGYHIADIVVDGVSQGPVAGYTFFAVAADGHTITASFAIDTFTITASAGAGGSISPVGTVPVSYGDTPSFAITPNAGYHIAGVLVGGVSQGAVSAYTFPAVTADQVISASFALNQYTLSYTAGPNGAISGTILQTVFYLTLGTQVTAVPATGYHFVGWSDGVLTAARTDLAGAANLSVTASFAIDTFTITPVAGANGSITPAIAQTVTYGSTPTFSITAATGYYVADVLVDGVSIGPITKYTFPAVATDHVISASFAVGVQTTFSISVAKSVVDYGGSTVLTGVLYSSADPLHPVGMGAQAVTLQSASSTAGPWADLNTHTTSSIAGSVGTFALTVAPTGPTYYRLRFLAAADSGYGNGLSYFVRVSVRPVLGTPTMPLSARVRKSFTVRGTLSPRFPAGQKIVQIGVYRLQGRRWVLTDTVPAVSVDGGATSRYRANLKLAAKGKYRFRAYTVATVIWASDTTALSRILTVR